MSILGVFLKIFMVFHDFFQCYQIYMIETNEFKYSSHFAAMKQCILKHEGVLE